MISVDYRHEFGYLPAGRNRSFPGLPIQIRNPNVPDQAVEVPAHLDSGTECSLFGGWIARSIGLDLLDGPPRHYASTAGASIEARVHRVALIHHLLGTFPLEVGFSVSNIHRNLLGRDFFNLLQIGFRERHLAFYVTPSP